MTYDTRNPTPSKTAYDAAELIRQLNHETLNAKSMSAPEICRAVRNLADLVDRLPQAFEQLAYQLIKQNADGRVLMDDRSDPAGPVTLVASLLKNAATLTEPANRERYGTPASPLSEALHDASGVLYGMEGVVDSDDTCTCRACDPGSPVHSLSCDCSCDKSATV